MGAKKKSVVIGYWYRLGVQIAIAHAPVDKITQLVFGERTAWSGEIQDGHIDIDKRDLFGGEKREGGVAGRITVYSGKKDQPIDPYVETMRGATSAQRGLLTMVFGSAGRSQKSQLRAINFNMSIMSEYAESALGYNPRGLLTTNREITKEQAYSFVSNFYDGVRPYREGSNEDINRNGRKGEFVDPIEEQKKIYGTYRAAALMYAYRAFVVGNLIQNPKTRMSASEFFANEIRDEVIDRKGTQPFYWAAMSPYFKSIWVRVQSILDGWSGGGAWYPEKAIIQGSDHFADDGSRIPCNDMNPAHIIFKILTNASWGMGYTPSDIDEVSFKAAADTLFNESFGLSLAWRNEEAIEDFIGKILDTIDATLRINVITGKFELILIRDNYDVAKLPTLNEDCIISVDSFERASWGDSPNEVVLTYRDRNESNAVVTVQNLSAIEIQGNVISSNQTYEGVHEPELATKIAQRELHALSTPLAKISLKTNRLGFLLQHGDVFRFQWDALGIVSMPCRVMNITRGEFDDGTITIEAVEDVFGMPKQTYASQQEVLWTDTRPRNILPVSNVRIWEAPYYDVVAFAGEAAVKQANMNDGNSFVRLLADSPNAAAQSYDALVAYNDVEAEYKKVLTQESFTSNFQLADPVGYLDEVLTVAWIENPPSKIEDTMYIVIKNEAMRIMSINEELGEIRVERAILDTLPDTHGIGEFGWITDARDGADETFHAQGDRLHYRLLTNTTRGTLSFENSTVFEATLEGRAYKPLPPANVMINSMDYPSEMLSTDTLNLTWDGRNRKFASLKYSWKAGHAAPEENTTYSLKIVETNTENAVFEQDGITDFSLAVKPPKNRKSVVLPTSITGLVYHYNFKNTRAPVAGTNNTQFVSKGTSYTDGAVTGDKAIEFSGDGFVKLSMDAALNNNSFAVGARFRHDSEAHRVYIPQDKTGKGRCALWTDTSNVYFGFYSFGKLRAIVKSPIEDIDRWSDVVVNVDYSSGKVSLWVNDGEISLGVISPLFKLFTYTASEPVNLWIRKTAVANAFEEGSADLADSLKEAAISDYIPVTAGAKYSYRAWTNENSYDGGENPETFYCFYDAAKRPINTPASVYSGVYRSNGTIAQGTTITAPAKAAFIRIGSNRLYDGLAMFVNGTTIPSKFNAAANDTLFTEVNDGVYVGKGSIPDSDGAYGAKFDNSIVLDELFVFNKALNESEFKAVCNSMLLAKWPQHITIELASKRDNVESWQTFTHSMTTK
jgi:hypothetical protein